jgi:Domain of unknown function (DUF4430)
MRTPITTLAVALLIAVTTAGVAWASPTDVNVRIEGRSETLFEGPILTEGHDVRAASDTEERSCDGIDVDDPENITPGPTPTAASADAMSLIGETFDGQWYNGYEDYFITRWGPDEQDEATAEYWGILVNNVFTNVGGCQYELRAGDEVLWVYNGFGNRALLALLAVNDHYSSGTRPLTAIAELGKPFEVEVLDYADRQEDKPPVDPGRAGSSPFPDADVSPVHTDEEGFEKVETGSPETVTTDGEGKASITSTEPGWHRIKATAFDTEGEDVRSNRLDVCVPADGASGCGEPPAEDQVRTPPHTAETAQHEAEAKLHAEETERHEEEAEPEMPSLTLGGDRTKPEGTNQPPPAPPVTTPPVLTTPPFSAGASQRSSPATAKQPTIAKRHSQARCVHSRKRRTASYRRVRRKCKIVVTPRPKPKRDPSPRRRNR